MRGPVSDLRQVSQRADSNTRTSGPEGLERDPGLEFGQVAIERDAAAGADHSQGQVADGRIDHGPVHGAILAPGTDSFWRLYDRQQCADDVLFSLGHSVLCYF